MNRRKVAFTMGLLAGLGTLGYGVYLGWSTFGCFCPASEPNCCQPPSFGLVIIAGTLITLASAKGLASSWSGIQLPKNHGATPTHGTSKPRTRRSPFLAREVTAGRLGSLLIRRIRFRIGPAATRWGVELSGPFLSDGPSHNGIELHVSCEHLHFSRADH